MMRLEPPARAKTVLEQLRGKKIHVLGPSGTEGSAITEFLLDCGFRDFTVHDLQPPARFEETLRRTHCWLDSEGQARLAARLRDAPIAWRQGGQYLEGIEGAEIVFVPQSWFRYPENERVRAAAARGARLSSLTHLFFELWPGPILGVTGTNGKFTVVTLIAAMMKTAGLPHVVSGNDRTHVPATYALAGAHAATWLVLELSNRQLLGLPYSPHLAVVTNIAPHHLDDHGSLEAYIEAKRTIVRHQGPGDITVLNADDPHVADMAGITASSVRWFSRRRPVSAGAYLDAGRIVLAGAPPLPVLEVRDLAAPGAHMQENALAAAAAAAVVGIEPGAIAQVLRAFRGLPYRLRVVGEREGVSFYEDSLATNPAAAAAAISSMDRPFHLIAGGHRVGARVEDFQPMLRALEDSPARGVYLIGATASILADAIGGMPAPLRVEQAGTLEAALASAWDAAAPGEAILLSPGCESFDQFTDYRQRGDRFCQLIDVLPTCAARREQP